MEEKSSERLNKEMISLEVANHVLSSLMGIISKKIIIAEDNNDLELVEKLKQQELKYADMLKNYKSPVLVQEINTTYAAELRKLIDAEIAKINAIA
jgi:hypothetical protein